MIDAMTGRRFSVLMPSRAFIVFNGDVNDIVAALERLNALTGIHCF